MGCLFLEAFTAFGAGWLGPQNIGKGPAPDSIPFELVAGIQQVEDGHHNQGTLPTCPCPQPLISGNRPEVMEDIC